MSNQDSSLYTLRYNEITAHLEAQAGLNWFPLAISGSGAAGSNTQIQFNNSGVLGASPNLTFTGSVLSENGQFIISNDNPTDPGSANVGSLFIRVASDHNRQLQISYNTTENVAYIQSAIYGFSTEPLSLQPIGGSVLGSGTENQALSAVLQADSTNQGFLVPRMTNTQRDAIAAPAEGLQIYSLTDHTIEFWNGSVWKQVATV